MNQSCTIANLLDSIRRYSINYINEASQSLNCIVLYTSIRNLVKAHDTNRRIVVN